MTLFRPLPPDVEQALLEGLSARLLPVGLEALAVQRRGEGADVAFEVVHGQLPADLLAREAGLAFRVDPSRGQNLGFFLDMRNARAWLRERAAGRSVLNLFAFTCAFSVVARAAGAARVVNIDLSRPSLSLGRDNHRLNELATDDIHFLDHDLFRSWNKLHKQIGRAHV